VGFLFETKAKAKERGQAVTDPPFELRKPTMAFITKLNGAKFGKYIFSMAVYAEQLSYPNRVKTLIFPSNRAEVPVGHRFETAT